MGKESVKKWSNFVCPHALFSLVHSHIVVVVCLTLYPTVYDYFQLQSWFVPVIGISARLCIT